jgi:hypothetical protein
MKTALPQETREADVSFRGLIELDEDKLKARRQDRHLDRLARRMVEQATRREIAEQGTDLWDAGYEEEQIAELLRVPSEQEMTEDERRVRDALGNRYAHTLSLDCEFETTVRQAPRVGAFMINGLDSSEIVARVRNGTFDRKVLEALREFGYIYDPERITSREFRVLESEHRRLRRVFARMGYGAVKVSLYALDNFVRYVWRRWVQREELQCAVVGHNLPVDLARLLDPADLKPGTGRYAGGFSCGLRWDAHAAGSYLNKRGEPVPIPPPRRLLFRHLGLHKDFLHLAHRWRDDHSGLFVDTACAGQALLGPGDLQLSSLNRRLRLPRQYWKLKSPDFSGPIDHAFLRYLRRDVFATYHSYLALADLWRQWGLPGELHELRSPASVGKRLFRAIGIRAAAERPSDLTFAERGWFLSTYSGGRVETNRRLRIVRGQYRDYRSLYPLVNVNLRLQDFVLAERITSRDATEWVRELLTTQTPAQLKRWCLIRSNWQTLRVIVKFRPNGKLPLPARADYSHSGTTASHNMGDNYLLVPPGLPEPWFTLADLIAGIIRSPFLDPDALVHGQLHMPPVLAARELVPEGRTTTNAVDLFGDSRYRIDLSAPEIDLFARLIDLRGEVQREIRRLKHDRPEVWQAPVEYLGGIQEALKLVANSTAYGVLVEFILKEPTAEKPTLWVHSLVSKESPIAQLEVPGEYSQGEVGTFITAGARLMQALAEQLCLDHGIRSAYMDTDSDFLAQPGWNGDQPGPEAMDDATFRGLLDGVAAELQVLNPFAGNTAIWKIEEENYAPDPDTLDEVTEHFEPLYGLFICDKRGALFNLPEGSDGRKAIRIRKFSAHGLGLWGGRHDYQSPDHIPAPWTRSVVMDEQSSATVMRPDAHKLGGPCWVYDLWHDFLWTLANGRYPNGDRLRMDHDSGAPDFHSRAIDNPAWARPAYYQQTLSNWQFFELYGGVDGLLPYNFVTVAPSPVTKYVRTILDRVRQQQAQHQRFLASMAERGQKISPRLLVDTVAAELLPNGWLMPTDDRYREMEGRAVYTAFCTSDAEFERAWAEGRVLVRAKDGKDPLANQPVPHYLRPKALGEVVRDHFTRTENKRAGGKQQGAGWLAPLVVVATRYRIIGKEFDQLALEQAEETDFQIGQEEALGNQDLGGISPVAPSPAVDRGRRRILSDANAIGDLDVATVRAIFARHDATALVRASGLPKTTVYSMRARPEQSRSASTLVALLRGAAQLDAERSAPQE